MVSIFAARYQDGSVRYVADAERGLACACTCLVCGSPMQAKKGDINDWHFAHVNGQERPECYAGAANLLRRLALEQILAGGFVLPLYSQPHPMGGVPLTWTDAFAGPLEMTGSVGPDAPVATVLLERGGKADVYITVGRESAPPGGPTSTLWASVPVPEGQVIRSEADAVAFVRKNLHLSWLWLPDFHGLVAKARQEAEEKLRRLREAFQRAEEERAREAGRRWYAIRQGMEGPAAAPARSAAPPAPATQRPGGEERMPREWCPGLAGRGSIQLRRMKDGTKWVYYPAGEYWRVAPVPNAFGGWDEYFSPGVAVVDGDRSLKVVSQTRLEERFRREGVFTFIDSDPELVAQRFAAA